MARGAGKSYDVEESAEKWNAYRSCPDGFCRDFTSFGCGERTCDSAHKDGFGMLAHLLQYIKQQWATHVENQLIFQSSAAVDGASHKQAQYSACDRCKSMHLRCDGEKPCKRCATAGCVCVHQPPTKRGPKPRDRMTTKNKACQRCNTMHLKCDGQSPCKRCASVDCECLYQPPTKRGPKRKDGRQPRKDYEKDALVAENLRLARELEELKKRLGLPRRDNPDNNSTAGASTASSAGSCDSEDVNSVVPRKRIRED